MMFVRWWRYVADPLAQLLLEATGVAEMERRERREAEAAAEIDRQRRAEVRAWREAEEKAIKETQAIAVWNLAAVRDEVERLRVLVEQGAYTRPEVERLHRWSSDLLKNTVKIRQAAKLGDGWRVEQGDG